MPDAGMPGRVSNELMTHGPSPESNFKLIHDWIQDLGRFIVDSNAQRIDES